MRVDKPMAWSMKKFKRFVWGGLIGLCLFFSALSAWGEEKMDMLESQCISLFPRGKVNWSTGKVSARGKAIPVDRQKADSPDFILSRARSDARRNLIETLKSLDIHRGYCVEALAESDDHILAGIEKRAMDATLIKQSYTSDRTMEVVLETTLFGGFLQLVLPEEIKSIPTLQILDPPVARDKEISEYTGLIIDATGIGFSPVLYPVVISELGSEIYSSLFISREIAVQQGVCRYVCDINFFDHSEWVGENPIIVKPLRMGGPGNSSIVISRSDADTIEKTRERHRFMRECRVIIVVSQAPDDRPAAKKIDH